MFRFWLASIPVIACSACTSVPAKPAQAQQVAAAGTAAPAAPTGADMLVATLTEGERAAALNDYPALLRAAQRLQAIGARPEQGSEDVAELWREQALAHGAAVDGQAVPYRGRLLGPAYRKGQLPAGGTVMLQQIFVAGERARVALVSGDGGRFSLEVTDPSGTPPCAHDAASAPNCTWLPTFTARYNIRVRNTADNSAHFYLTLN